MRSTMRCSLQVQPVTWWTEAKEFVRNFGHECILQRSKYGSKVKSELHCYSQLSGITHYEHYSTCCDITNSTNLPLDLSAVSTGLQSRKSTLFFASVTMLCLFVPISNQMCCHCNCAIPACGVCLPAYSAFHAGVENLRTSLPECNSASTQANGCA